MTAYAMLIMHWSSDVCSSDLEGVRPRRPVEGPRAASRRTRMTKQEATNSDVAPSTAGLDASTPLHLGRRRFLGYVLGGATLMAAADLGLMTERAAAAVPTLPSIPELYDLNDLPTHAAAPTANLITININEDGTASFALPRAEVGQGITTSTAMIIAEELDLPLEKVIVTLAPARPELLFNQTRSEERLVGHECVIRLSAQWPTYTYKNKKHQQTKLNT